ncbi:hypothetical protein LCGC14_1422850 [marine sediment metagenome]|uniref:Uncharacterized protein n=1 Tax=marine sediment metagenome TaxID=412755 RepID=A0A0F9JRC7_9ZZZZ
MTRWFPVAALCCILTGCASTPKPKVQPVLKTSGWRSEDRSFQDCMAGPRTYYDQGYLTGCSRHDYDLDWDVDVDDWAYWDALDREATADNPENWAVLFNKNDDESREWAAWYMARRGIPLENALGLDVNTTERVHVDYYRANIHNAVWVFLNDHRNIMGIIVGFRVPGTFYTTAAPAAPSHHGGGGYSIANALANLAVISGPIQTATGAWRIFPTTPNPHYGEAIPNRRTMGAGIYMTARVDGPTLEAVKRLSPLTAEITRSGYFYHDAQDSSFGEWTDLIEAQAALPALPWRAFDSDSEGTPDAVFRASWHRITGWDQRIWDQTGPRFLAIDNNSFGATTVRSTTAHGSRFVPVALFQGGYLAAIGATAEPLAGTLPDVTVLLDHLGRGERLGVAVFMANPHFNWMWELCGDPLLRLTVRLP